MGRSTYRFGTPWSGIRRRREKDYPGDQWETIRTDLYFRRKACVFQTSKVSSAICGIARMCNFQRRRRARHRTSVFRLFNNCELYVDGVEVAKREIKDLWWLNDYRSSGTCRCKIACKPAAMRLHCVVTTRITWAACFAAHFFMHPVRWRNGRRGASALRRSGHPQNDGVIDGVGLSPAPSIIEDDHGPLCGDRRVLEASSVCVVDEPGRSCGRRRSPASRRADRWFASLGLDLARIGLEAGRCRNGFTRR